MKARWNILRLRSITTTPLRAITVAATMVLVLGTIGVTLASATTPSQTYTGCLKLGLVFNVAIGTNPLLPCPSGSLKVSWNQTGPAGANGANGTNGAPGKSAYQIWLDQGNAGSPDDFIASLRGPAGRNGMDGNLALAGQGCTDGHAVIGFGQTGNVDCGMVDGSAPDQGEDCRPLNPSFDADMHACDLSSVDLSGVLMGSSDLSGADLSGATLRFANLTYADLSNANLSRVNLNFAHLSNADLSGAILSNAILNGEANESGVIMSNANLSAAYLVGVNLSEVNLSGANLGEANLSGADLSGADLSGANLGGAIWAGTICPDGTNSYENGETCVGHL